MTGEGLPILVDLVDRGIVRILDLMFLRKELDGSVAGWPSPTSTHDGVGLTSRCSKERRPACSAPARIKEAGSVIEPGSSAGLLVYENVWAGPFASALRRGGGQLVASGRIPVQAVLPRWKRATQRPDQETRRNRSCQVCLAGSRGPPSSREPRRRVQPRVAAPSGPMG